jgi:hypothetical protein
MPQHNERLHIFSMIGDGYFHKKIIAEVRLVVFRSNRDGRRGIKLWRKRHAPEKTIAAQCE